MEQRTQKNKTLESVIGTSNDAHCCGVCERRRVAGSRHSDTPVSGRSTLKDQDGDLECHSMTDGRAASEAVAGSASSD